MMATMAPRLPGDPCNIIITGVGGQGNVMAARVLAGMLANRGYMITIGETFGASQRGGSVMSHIRASVQGTWSPRMPKGSAHIVVALEPVEALRVLSDYGHPGVIVLANTRPVYPIDVITGELGYPSPSEIEAALLRLSAELWMIDATDRAVSLGNAVLANIIMVGALTALNILPVSADDFRIVIERIVTEERLGADLEAFSAGMGSVGASCCAPGL
ncbi:MAG: 2-oxoacid:acceptor oxidoreductase family protein [Syntrophales bacterium]|jgi:indolepyruvate ferredoxin oxidoreductase beta subunit|nr:2-oxoacid:acceptor oxidoreductase family protein [Syntrophales bacterium]MCK9528624.1 2-oxoacid:acceptor oxidoreductase family protein [Syntrophales bacterium]MDX9923065.1 2-oxoacid:acceptor oxidoreductase family protein [Syntrophales bacterium]